MYLVELRPGKEELYRTGDELAAAIRSGEVDGHSRIYHRSTSKWISITLHPQYKAIVSQRAAHQTEAERLDARAAGGDARRCGGTPGQTRRHRCPSSEAADGPEGDQGDNPWRRPIALGISGLFLLFGIQLAFSGPRPQWSTARADESEIPAAATVEQVTSQQVVSLASTSTVWDEEPRWWMRRSSPRRAPKAPAVLPKAPRVAMKLPAALPGSSASAADSKTVDGLLADYGKAYENARSRLGSGMRVARLNQLFAISRLTPDGGVTDTRLGLAGVTNFIRVYREQEGSIERMYQDSFTAMSKDLGWSPKVAKQWYSRDVGQGVVGAGFADRPAARQDRQRTRGAERRGRRLPAGERQHPLRGPRRRAQYGDLRRNINAAMDAARIAGGEESEGPMGYLLKAIGTTRLPVES